MVPNTSQEGLKLLLQFVRARESGDPFAFRFESQDYILPMAGGDSPSAQFDWSPALLQDLAAVRRPGRDPALVQRVGERLRRFVQDAGWTQHESEISKACAERRPIYVTICSSAAELYTLPWELLALKSGQFLGEMDGLLIRFEWPESRSTPEAPRPRPEGGRILVAWSAAGGAVPAREHITAVSAVCEAGFHPFDMATDVLPNATLGRVVQALGNARQAGQSVAVLHLLCHGVSIGSTFGLMLDGESGPVAVDALQLRQQLAPFADMVRLVVLSACDTGNGGAIGGHVGSVAQALHRSGFQAVLASRFPLSASGSISLTERLHGTLLTSPASLETAVVAARQRLARDDAELPPEQDRGKRLVSRA